MKKTYSLTIGTFFIVTICSAAKWPVGPTRTYIKPSQVVALVQNGDTVNIDPGTYLADVCSWTKNNLVLRGVGGLAHLNANNTSSQRKAIWIISGSNTTVENIEFSHCHDVAGLDKNWAGIRMQGVGLTVRNCYFHDNDNGILEANVVTSDIVIQYTQFNHNGYADGYSHNLYIGHCKSLTFSYNYSHHALVGQELKSRAATSYILYNRIGNETTGNASREIDLPSGGLAIVMGNQLEQGPQSTNGNILGYGQEGLSTAITNELYLINNTFVNNRSAGNFVFVQTGTSKYKAYNNIFAGPGTLLSGTSTLIDTLKNWRTATVSSIGFVNAAAYDYHLISSSKAINKGAATGVASNGFSLNPLFEYKHPINKVGRINIGIIDLGAYEFRSLTTAQAFEINNPSPVEFYVYLDAYDNTINLFFTNLLADKDVYIYDIMGKLVATQGKVVSSKISFDKSSLTPGIYIAQARVGNGLMNKKFVIQ